MEAYAAAKGGICLCSCFFNFLGKLCKADNHQARLLGYIFIFFVYYGLGIFSMYTFSRNFMSIFKDYLGCPEGQLDACYGASIIFRLSFSLFVFFLLILCLMLPKDDFSYRANRHCWMAKWSLPMLFFIGCCFIKNPFFETFASLSKYFGIIYLLIQDFSFNEFFFRWTNTWIMKAKNNCCYAILYVLFFIVSFGGTVIFLILNFMWNWKEGCGTNKFWLILNLIILLIFYIMTAICVAFPDRFRDDVNFVGTSLFSIYTTYYFYSGMASNTDQVCSSVFTDKLFVITEILIASFLILVVFMFMAFLKSIPFYVDKKDEEAEEAGGEVTREVRYQRQMRAGGLGAGTPAYDKLEYRTYKYVWVFMGFVFLVCYYQNIVTNWGTVPLFEGVYLFSSDQAGYYIKIFNAIFNSLLYLYVLFAPIIFPDRKFGNAALKPTPQTLNGFGGTTLPPIGGANQA